MAPRTRDYVLLRGRSYRRPELGPEWVLERFPARPGGEAAACRRLPAQRDLAADADAVAHGPRPHAVAGRRRVHVVGAEPVAGGGRPARPPRTPPPAAGGR